jgi:hypothetical protein
MWGTVIPHFLAALPVPQQQWPLKNRLEGRDVFWPGLVIS